MTDVVSVRFVSRGKKYFFDPNGIQVAEGDRVIVETAKGLDIGECAAPAHPVDDSCIVQPLRPIVRIATEDDLKTDELNKKLEKEAFGICKKKIAHHELEMKLVGVECSFEGNKILFFFTSDGRVDFRELVKDLASVFHTRIELRQIGVRDETKMIGGLGVCGRPYCCSQFLDDFAPVSTKMAKTQSMSLNPTKISGSCGRLMCCLRYEQEAYEELLMTVPKNGAFVQTVDGYGSVVQSNVLRQRIKVRMDGGDEQDIRVFDAAQLAVVPGGRPKPGEALPNVLKYVPPAPVKEVPEDPWKAPSMFADNVQPPAAEEEKRAPRPRDRYNRGHNKKPQGGRPNANTGGKAGGNIAGGQNADGKAGGFAQAAPGRTPETKQKGAPKQEAPKPAEREVKKSGKQNRRYRPPKPKNKSNQSGGNEK